MNVVKLTNMTELVIYRSSLIYQIVNAIRGRPKPIYAHTAVTGPKLKISVTAETHISVTAVPITRPKLVF